MGKNPVRNYAVEYLGKPTDEPSPAVTVAPVDDNQEIVYGDPPPSGTGLIEEQATAETDTTLVLRPDGDGGVEWAAEAGGAADWYFDPRDYGAVLDDTTDDTAAIQACIDAMPEYATMIFPGKAVITDTLDCPRAIRFLGTGAYPNPDTSPDGFSQIRMTANNTTAIEQSAIKRIALEHMVIDNDGTQASGKGLLALGAVSMRHSLIRDFYDNLFIDGQGGGSYVTTIDESFFHGAGRANIWLDDKINNFHMRGGAISTGPYGLVASGGIFALSIDGTAIESYSTAGIYIDGTGPGSGQRTNSVALLNLTMDTIVGTAPDIWIGDTSSVQSVTIVNPWIEPGNTGMTHIRIDAADKVTIIGGRCSTPGGGSVSFDGTGATDVLFVNFKYDGTLANMPASFVELRPGATPGGELGGTWASPTVDTTHSGSSHAGAVATAEAYSDAALAGHTGDASDAHDASAISFVPAGSIAATDVQAAIEEVASEASSGASGGDHEHVIDVFNGDGSTTAFEISQEPLDPEEVFAFVGGSWTAVTMSGAMNTIATFGSAPGSGTGNVVIQYPAIAA